MGRITKISTVGMSREDWLAERRKSLGGSDVGAILGLNRWRSPYSVWADKRGLIPDEPDNEAMRTGRDLEHPVITNLLRTGEPDGREPRPITCPACGAECDTFYLNRFGSTFACENCVRIEDAAYLWEE